MNDKSKLIIAFQGMAGAYSNMACEAYFPNSKTLACTSFEDMLNSTKMVNQITQWSLLRILWLEEWQIFII